MSSTLSMSNGQKVATVLRLFIVPVLTALLTLLVQAVFWGVTVRDDVRTVKRDVQDMKLDQQQMQCDLAVALKRTVLPERCNVNPNRGTQP